MSFQFCDKGSASRIKCKMNLFIFTFEVQPIFAFCCKYIHKKIENKVLGYFF